MTKFIWVVGSPRSGSTFLTNYIGKYTDKKYNEPWETHPIEAPRLWRFPNVNKIVFKYCENWRNLHTLMNLHPNSVYVHIWRDPDNVVQSMAYPKDGSKPPRNLYNGYHGEERVRLCMQRWYSNMMHCLSIFNILPQQYIEVRYENMWPGLVALGKHADINFKMDDFDFGSRNADVSNDWSLNPTAKKLYDLLLGFDKGQLASWLNDKRPKFLQRVIL